jgi:hypothetical protein
LGLPRFLGGGAAQCVKSIADKGINQRCERRQNEYRRLHRYIITSDAESVKLRTLLLRVSQRARLGGLSDHSLRVAGAEAAYTLNAVFSDAVSFIGSSAPFQQKQRGFSR